MPAKSPFSKGRFSADFGELMQNRPLPPFMKGGNPEFRGTKLAYVGRPVAAGGHGPPYLAVTESGATDVFRRPVGLIRARWHCSAAQEMSRTAAKVVQAWHG